MQETFRRLHLIVLISLQETWILTSGLKKHPRSFAYSAQDLYNLEGAIWEVQGFEAFFL